MSLQINQSTPRHTIGHADLFKALFEPTDLVELRAFVDQQVFRQWVPANELASFQLPESWLCKNVCFGANPRATRGSATKDVALARCLFVDFDHVNIKEAEKRIADADLPKPNVFVSSGSGIHAYWRLAEPMTNLDSWRDRQKALIAALDSDHVVHDPPRIMRLPGTANRKYDPPRLCKLIFCYPVSRHLITAFPKVYKKESAPTFQNGTAINVNANDIERRAIAYLQAMPPAISGQHGHDKTYAAATSLVHGFGLGSNVALRLLEDYYNPKCNPHWSERELIHKIEDAANKPHNKPFGYLRDSSSPILTNKGLSIMTVPNNSQEITNNQTTNSELTNRSRAHVKCFAEIKSTKIEWLWPGRIALGKLTVIAGPPGLGKSFLTCDLAARVSTGLLLPDSNHFVCGDVLMLNAEDDPADTIRPRLDAAGADVRRIRFMDGVAKAGEKNIDPFDLDQHTPILREYIQFSSATKLVVIDPVTAFTGSVNDHRNTQVRALLRPLSELANESGVSIVMVTHLNKGTGSATNRIIGSIAWSAAARSVWGVFRDPHDKDRRVFLNIKNNIGLESLGLAFRIEMPDDLNAHENPSSTPRLIWEDEPLTLNADEILGNLNGEDTRNETKISSPACQEAASFLREVLMNGPVHSIQLRKEAEEAGVSWSSIKRAKKQVGVEINKIGNSSGSKWVWSLPNSKETFEEAHDIPLHSTLSIFEEVERLRSHGTKNGVFHRPPSKIESEGAQQAYG